MVVILTLCIIHLIGLHNNVESSYNRYLNTEQWYIQNGIDTIEALESDNNVVIEGASKTTDNPLKDDYITLSIAIQNLKPQNVIGNTLEYLVFTLCTLIFGIYAHTLQRTIFNIEHINLWSQKVNQTILF